MRTLKYIPLGLALSFALAAAPARSQIQRMVDELSLTADQKVKIDPILEDDAKQVRAFRDDTSLSADDRKAKTAKVRHETNAKIKPILTEDQWKKLVQLREDRKKERKNSLDTRRVCADSRGSQEILITNRTLSTPIRKELTCLTRRFSDHCCGKHGNDAEATFEVTGH